MKAKRAGGAQTAGLAHKTQDIGHPKKHEVGHSEGFTPVAQIVTTFGLKGQVRVNPLTDFLDRFEPGARLRVNGVWTEVESIGEHKGRLNLKLSGIDTLEQAEALRGAHLEIPSGDKPKLEKDEYITAELIGLLAETPEGEVLGKVDDVQWSPAHDLLVIGEIVVPAVKAFVKKVNLQERKIVIELIPGMRPGE